MCGACLPHMRRGWRLPWQCLVRCLTQAITTRGVTRACHRGRGKSPQSCNPCGPTATGGSIAEPLMDLEDSGGRAPLVLWACEGGRNLDRRREQTKAGAKQLWEHTQGQLETTRSRHQSSRKRSAKSKHVENWPGGGAPDQQAVCGDCTVCAGRTHGRAGRRVGRACMGKQLA